MERGILESERCGALGIECIYGRGVGIGLGMLEGMSHTRPSGQVKVGLK